VVLLPQRRDLDFSLIISNVILIGYFIVGSLLEERKLCVEFPGVYEEYRQRVSMLFPYRWLISRWKE
jgi:protein-S-isoprenylcysteine O-methyltransferase Ste14